MFEETEVVVLVIQDVCVVAEGAVRLRHQDVVAVGERIVSIQTTGGTFAEGVTVVDARRMFVVSRGLHRELTDRLAVAGVANPLDAVWPWPFEHSRTSVAPGARADLVLLGGNPLEDVRNLAQVHGTVVAGVWHPSAALHPGRSRLRLVPPPIAVGAR